ncbi:ankyrin-3-like [Saccostrea echinata]|uniref:ankyrin-3-like n=1 Tax=Saccostrea echinata TaxID=191078 RepID=UPI002A81FF73|nr:ankyrin-3-like [Saccostrea echinata]
MAMLRGNRDNLDDTKREIYKACREGQVEELIRLVGGNANMEVKDGQKPLHIVALSGREDMESIISALLKIGSDVNATTTTDEDTVLHLVIKHAVLRLAFQTCLMILEHNPDLDIRNKNLRTPYDVAMAQEYFELANVLDGSMTAEEAREYYTKSLGELYGGRLIDAVMNNNEKEALDCVNQGADCNCLNKHGAGAIHYMFTNLYQHPPLNLLSRMVDAEADVNLRDYEGDTALNLAIKRPSLRQDNQMYNVVDQLLKWGADPTHKDLDGNDALALAESRNYLDVVKLLKRQKTARITPPPPIIAAPPRQSPTPSESSTLPPLSPSRALRPSPTPRRNRGPERNHESPTSSDSSTLPRASPNRGLRPTPSPSPEQNRNIEPDHEESITSAIEEDNPDDLDELLSDPDANLNVPNSMGLFPLHVAILRNNPASRNNMVQRILNKGADINVKAMPAGNTPLHMSVARDQLDTVRILLSYDPAISPTNDEGQTPYNYAEENGNAEMMRLLKDQEQRVQRSKNKSSTCPVDELDELLRDPEANVNVQNSSGLFPLHVAIMKDDPLIRETLVKRLISRGADINAKAIPKPEKKTPLTARKAEPREIEERGRTQSFDEVKASVKDRRKEHDGLDELINDPDANVNIRNANGLYPLHQAIMRNDPVDRNQLIEALIRRGADINGRALKSGNTPLHLAVTRGQLGTTRLLLSCMPTLSVPNNAGKTPYTIAEENGNMEILSLLESYKRNVVNKRRNQSVRDKQNCVIS